MKAPVTIFIIILLAFIYFTGTGEAITDCSNHTFSQYLKHSFVHADVVHLLVNLATFFSLIYLEERYGSTKYGFLIIIILFLSSLIHTFINFGTCSVGFSGVIIGILIYQLVLRNNSVIDMEFVKQVGLLLLVPWLLNPQISITGHAAGAFAGLILAYIIK